MTRKIGLVVAAVLLPASLLTVSGNSVHAEVYTCGTKSNYFDGYYRAYGQGSAEGANAQIVNRYGAVCDTDTSGNNFVATWAMIANNGGGGWVQSGYIRWYDHTTVFFSQISKTGDPNFGQFDTKFGTSSLAYGDTNHYYEKWVSSCSCDHSNIDSTTWLSTTFNPFNAWFLPFSPQFSGEAAYKQNDMPGNSSTPTSFTDLHYQDYTDSWVSYGCNLLTKSNDLAGVTRSDGESWYDRITSCPNFDIYTDTAGMIKHS